MDQKQRTLLVVLVVLGVLILSLGLLIGLYEKNYAGLVPPVVTYGRNGTREAAFLLEKEQIPVNGSALCKQFNLENVLKDKLHGVQFSAIIDNEQAVNHLSLWACTKKTASPKDTFECSSGTPDECNYLLYNWGPGQGPLTYPEQVGLSFDPSTTLGKYFLIQVRYSPQAAPATDSSGVFVSLTTKVREFDGGVFPVGVAYGRISIPPATNFTEITGGCSSDATKVVFQNQPVRIFGAQLHAHSLATKVSLEQFRNNLKLRDIAREDTYSWTNQPVYPTDVEFQAGDQFQIRCEYNSKSRNTTTLGGEHLTNEQCLAYLVYYPALSVPNYCVDNSYRPSA